MANNIEQLLAAANMSSQALEAIGIAGNRSVEALTTLAKASQQADGTLSKYSGGVSLATRALGDLAGQIPVVGAALGGLVKIIGAGVTSVMAQSDAALKAKDALNQFGFGSLATAREIQELGKLSGYTADELERYAANINTLGTDALSLGKTFGQGAKKFMSSIANVSTEMIAEYGMMGISQEQLTKSQASYIKLISTQGIQITANTDAFKNLQQNSLKYTDNLMVLAAMSGEDIETIKRKQEAARADVNFQIGQSIKAKKAAELEDAATKAADMVEKQRLQEEAKNIRRQIEANEKLQDVAQMMGLGGQDLSAFSQMIQTGTFTELSAKFAPFGSDLLGFIKDVQEGREDASKLAIKLAKMTDRTLDAVGTAATLAPQEIQNSMLLTTEGIKRAAQLRGISEEEYVKMIDKEREEIKKRAKLDREAESRAARLEAEKNMKIGLESLTDLIRGPVITAFKYVAEIVNYVAKKLQDFVNWIKGTTGVGKTPTVAGEQAKLSAVENISAAAKEMGGTSAHRTMQQIHDFIGTAGTQQQQEKIIKANALKKDGAEIDHRVLALARGLVGQDWFAGGRITSLNDEFHTGMQSQHVRGKAIDFTIPNYGADPDKDKLIGDKVKEFADSYGGKLIDEYANPSKKSTGGHFHVQFARRGLMPDMNSNQFSGEFARRGLMPGMVNAPDSGRLVEVHGREMIAPLDPNSIIAQLLTASPDKANSIMNSMNNTNVSEELRAGFSGMIDRMESLISKINVLNSTQEEMLVYNRG